MGCASTWRSGWEGSRGRGLATLAGIGRTRRRPSGTLAKKFASPGARLAREREGKWRGVGGLVIGTNDARFGGVKRPEFTRKENGKSSCLGRDFRPHWVCRWRWHHTWRHEFFFFYFLVFLISSISFVLSVQITSNLFLKIYKNNICNLKYSNTLFQHISNFEKIKYFIIA